MAKPPVEEVKRLTNDKRSAYHKHLAIHILIQEQIKALQARAKANLKAAENQGIPGKKIKVTHDLAKKPPSEIAKHYSEEFELLQYQGIDLGGQFNIFGGVDVQTPKKGPDFYGAGLFAALDGKDGKPPANIKQADQQRWIEGWQDGIAARVLGQEYLDNAQATLDAAQNDKPQAPADDQTDLEGAIEDSKKIRVGISEFGPEAKLAEIELVDLGLTAEEIEKAVLIEVVDADGRRNVFKSPDGKLGLKDPLKAGDDGFEATPEELAAQKARPSTIKATEPAADTKH